ncbi:protein NRT1/ PTR FAMILY 8.3-like isoform X3 [Lolium rigidum]|uniref:protein NRT1/ PTR FAMILY 8.3-like isoform X3 n=1 Tax=Lolium rigidum TaxID=89674 RepID=UPI001F5CB37F|nr:protein NRT1/ PTR FAMILY 8.3-like isoform X3 [Lolium rigidum]
MASMPLSSRYGILLLPGVQRHCFQPRHLPHRRPGPEQHRRRQERVHLASHVLPHAHRRRRRRRLLLGKGMIMTALSAYLPLLVKNGASFTSSSMVSAQESVLFVGLYMIAVGLGGLRPCLMSFGADQFDDGDPSERVHKGSFFNWYVFNMNCASLISSTGIVWVQDHYGWPLGLTIPVAVLAVGLFCLVAASRVYRFQRTRGSPLTRVCQVVVAAVRNFGVEPPADSSLLYQMPEDDGAMKGAQRIDHTTDLRFFDKAASVAVSDKEAAALAPSSPWRLCAVTQVEELKILARMLPLWVTIVFFYAVTAQVSSTFVEQGMAMDAAVGSVRVPPASMSTFDMLTIVVLVPLYDRAFVPVARRLTGREKGLSDLRRIGAGLAMPVLVMAAAATVETVRLRAAPGKISELWQAPQYALVGVGEVLTTIGQLDFFYNQAPAAMKTVCTALGFLAIAAGNYLSSFILTAVQWATTTGGRPGWIPDDLNEGHLDRFFWMIAGLGCLNLMAYVSCAVRYKYRKAC